MAAYADVVFLGRVTGATADNPALQAAFDAFAGGPIEETPLGRQSWTGMVTTTFAVETVYKGIVASEAVVHSVAGDAWCGTHFGPTMRYVAYARYAASLGPGGSGPVRGLRDHAPYARLLTSLCDGSFVYFGDAAKQRAAVLGEGRPPAPAADATAIVEQLAELATAEAGEAATDTPVPVVAARSPAEGGVAEASPVDSGSLPDPSRVAVMSTPSAARSSSDAHAATSRLPASTGGARSPLGPPPLTTILAAALVVVIVAGTALWAIRPRSGR